jgi:hypothetical protein
MSKNLDNIDASTHSASLILQRVSSAPRVIKLDMSGRRFRFQEVLGLDEAAFFFINDNFRVTLSDEYSAKDVAPLVFFKHLSEISKGILIVNGYRFELKTFSIDISARISVSIEEIDPLEQSSVRVIGNKLVLKSGEEVPIPSPDQDTSSPMISMPGNTEPDTDVADYIERFGLN